MSNRTEITIKVDLGLLREQRDAVIRDIDHNLTLAGQDGTAEHIESLDGLVNMLDWMLDQGEGLSPDSIVEPWPVREVLPALTPYYDNEGSD